jgi:hypothetical protein
MTCIATLDFSAQPFEKRKFEKGTKGRHLRSLVYRRSAGTGGATPVNRFRGSDLPETNPESLRIQDI